jgi:FkbM family methyltransferase
MSADNCDAGRFSDGLADRGSPRRTREREWKNRFRRARHLWRAIVGGDLYLKAQVRCAQACLGNEGAEWCVCPTGLSEDSIVYSFGVGTDISFDLELIRQFGLRVHGFDPTPRAIAWVRSQRLPEKFIFHNYGIGARDGNALFRPPQNPDHVSYRVAPRGGPGTRLVEAPVHRLATILEKLRHERVDVLKMDIEGAEYEVVPDLFSCGNPVNQLLVEFHHGWREIGVEKTKEAVAALNRAGYKIFYVSPYGTEFSFVKCDPAPR